MQTNRRRWLQQLMMGTAALSLPAWPAQAREIQRPEPIDNPEKPIRLSSNENPYGPSPKAIQAMINSVPASNRYNWEIQQQLIQKIIQRHPLNEGTVLLGAGSTELIDLAMQWASRYPGKLLMPNPSYNYWASTAERYGLQTVTVALDAGKKINLDAVLQQADRSTRLIYICNPNNPTGTTCEPAALRDFIRKAVEWGVVLVDEAYLDYTDAPSMAPLTAELPNLIVVKTFSKIYGLAGARIGYLMAHPQTVEALSNLQSWNGGTLSSVSAAAALASLNDTAFVQSCKQKNQLVRTYALNELQRLKLNPIASETNFIYFSTESVAADYFGLLQEASITGTRIYEEQGKWTRITVGTMEEMKRFIKAIG